MQARPSHPKIQMYSDYRSFLTDFEKHSRAQSPHWSYGTWAKKLGLKSKSQLIMTIQGSRKLSPRLSERLVQYFKFNADETSYFKRLVSIEAKEKTTIHQVQVTNEGLKHKDLGTEADAELMQNAWLAFVVKETAASMEIDATAKKISEKICTKPDAKQVETLLHSLVKSGYLQETIDTNKNKTYTPAAQTPPVHWNIESMQKLHADGLRVCEEQGKKLSSEERIFQTSFIRIRKERLAEARILLRAFQKEFLRDLEEEDGNEIVQLNLHLFPVTNGLKS